MLVSSKCRYALRAVYEVGCAKGEIVTISRVAEGQKVPRRFLAGIMNELRKGGILDGVRGRSGGYRLARAPEEITVADVVRLIDGPIEVIECVQDDAMPTCPMFENCIFLPTWKRLQGAIDGALAETNFGDLLKGN